MSKDSIDPILTAVIVVAEVGVLAPVIIRKLWRVLPIFSVYLLWALLSDVSLFCVHTFFSSKFFTFYQYELITDSILMFVVLVELWWSVLRPVRSSLPKGYIFVIAGLIAVAGLIIWPLAGKTVPTDMTPFSLTIFRLQATFAMLRIACFLVIAGFSQLLAITWRDRELQVASGLGIYALVTIIVSVFHTHQAVYSTAYHRLDQMVSLSYLGTLVYWTVSFAAKEYQRKEFSPQMQQFLVYMGGTARAGSMALSKIPPDHSPRTRDK